MRLERNFELKSISSDGTFTGYGSIFGEHDYYDDIVVPGAFQKSLAAHAEKNRRIPMLWQHSQRDPIGVYTVVREDAKGLYVEGAVNMKVQRGVEAHALMEQGALSGLSIGYNTIRSNWNETTKVRSLLEVDLFEISLVTFPAGDSARIASVKSLESYSDMERWLRDAAHVSRKDAMTFLSRAKALMQPSDSDAAVKAIRSIIQSL